MASDKKVGMIINVHLQAIGFALGGFSFQSEGHFSIQYESPFSKDNLRVLFEVSKLINQKKKKMIIAVELLRV
jgi:hypothetical protein